MGKITNRNVSKFLADTHTEMSAVYSKYPQYQSIVDARAKHVLRENLYTARHPRLAGDFLTNKGLIFCLGFYPALKQGQHEYLLDAQQV